MGSMMAGRMGFATVAMSWMGSKGSHLGLRGCLETGLEAGLILYFYFMIYRDMCVSIVVY
jgi:hypothetical protein